MTWKRGSLLTWVKSILYIAMWMCPKIVHVYCQIFDEAKRLDYAVFHSHAINPGSTLLEMSITPAWWPFLDSAEVGNSRVRLASTLASMQKCEALTAKETSPLQTLSELFLKKRMHGDILSTHHSGIPGNRITPETEWGYTKTIDYIARRC